MQKAKVKKFMSIIAELFEVELEFTKLPKLPKDSNTLALGTYTSAFNLIEIDVDSCSDEIVALCVFFHELSHSEDYKHNPDNCYYNFECFVELSSDEQIDLAIKTERRVDKMANRLFNIFFPLHKYKKAYGFASDRKRLEAWYK